MRHSLPALVFVLALSSQAHAATDWTRVDSAMGRTAVVQAGEVHRYGFPRSDLAVTLDGVRLKPALALGSWLAFRADSWHYRRLRGLGCLCGPRVRLGALR